MFQVKRSGKITLLGLGLAVVLAVATAAGVNGIFNSVTSTLGYKVNGAAGSSGQALCSNGTLFATPCSLYNQTIASNGSAVTQRPLLNLVNGTNATVSCVDNGGSNRTDCTINQTASSAVDYYWTVSAPCTSGSGNVVACQLLGNQTLITHLPGNMPDASYEISCNADVLNFTGHPPAVVCGFLNSNDGQPTYSLPTTAAGNLYYDVIQLLDNGGSGGQPVVYFHAHHD